MPDGQGGQEVRYLLADHLGSTRVVLDGDGNVVARFEYGPHGETTAAGTAAAEVRYRYTGHPWDEAQGIYETPNRVYDPTLGRFFSMDPQRQGASPYVYAGNNPVGYLDPTGGEPVPFIVKSGLSTTGGANRVFKTFAVGLGGDKERRILDATTYFGQPESTETHYPTSRARRALYGPDGGTELLFNDTMYWIIGDEDEIGPKVPGEIANRLTTFRKVQTDFARRIVLIDISDSGTAHVGIHEALDSIHLKHGVMVGEVLSRWERPEGKESKKWYESVATGVRDRELDREFDLKTFRTMAERIGEINWNDWPTGEAESPRFTVPPATIFGEQQYENEHIEEIGRSTLTGDLSQGSNHEGELTSFPSVPPVSEVTPGLGGGLMDLRGVGIFNTLEPYEGAY